jgi:GT2 family glycosyltransferase
MKNWNVVTKNDGQLHIIKRSEKLPSGLFKAEYVGGTGILIRRDVIQKLNQPYMMTQRNEQGDIVKSEDYDFCDKVRDAGYDIWIDPEVKFGHQQSIDIGIYG